MIFADASERVELSAALMFFFALGAIAAPLTASYMIDAYGPSALFVMIATAHGILIFFGLTRMLSRSAPKKRTPYIYAPRTSFLIGPFNRPFQRPVTTYKKCLFSLLRRTATRNFNFAKGTNMQRHLITSAIPYINGIKHLGNLIGSQLPADLYARYQRARGNEVLFLCATDEHGTPAETSCCQSRHANL